MNAEDTFQAMDEWLTDNGYEWGDVMFDEEGEEYVLADGEKQYDKIYIKEEINLAND